MDFSGRAVFVTGASGGLGETIALSFSRASVRALIITGRSESRLSAVATQCRSSTPNVFSIIGDMNNAVDIDRIAQFVEEKSEGRLDIFIGNHGMALSSPELPEADLARFSTVMNINFMSMVRLTNILPRFMNEGGAVVFVTSANSTVPGRGESSYCCSKAALMMFMKCAALDLGKRKIRVNAVAPGYIDTPFQSPFFPSPEEQTTKLNALGATAPLGRIPSKQGITNTVLFLASDLAGDITGTEQMVDCGWGINWAS